MDKRNKTYINLNDKYRVVVDNYQFTLISKNDNNKDFVVGYYPTLHHALVAVKRLELTHKGELSLDEYINQLRKLEDWVTATESEERGQ